MSDDEAFTVICAVVGVGHMLGAYATWSRRARWEADAERRGFMRWLSGQRQLNTELALGVFFLGLAIFAV